MTVVNNTQPLRAAIHKVKERQTLTNCIVLVYDQDF